MDIIAINKWISEIPVRLHQLFFLHSAIVRGVKDGELTVASEGFDGLYDLQEL